MSAPKKALADLETRVERAVQRLRSLDTENQTLRQEIQQLREDLEEARKDKDTKNRVIKQLESDRLRIRSRVERVLQKVQAMEQPRES